MSGFDSEASEARRLAVSKYFLGNRGSVKPTRGAYIGRLRDEEPEWLAQYLEGFSPEEQKFIKTAVMHPQMAHYDPEVGNAPWPSGEEYPTEKDLIWFLEWLTAVGTEEKKYGFLQKLLGQKPDRASVDERYRAMVESGEWDDLERPKAEPKIYEYRDYEEWKKRR